MRIVIQRVSSAQVSASGSVSGKIAAGMLVLVGIEVDDTEEEVDKVADKTAALRIFNDESGIMNLSIKDIEGEILAVSQFTLLASTRRGNRPSYVRAARGEIAEPLYRHYCERLEQLIGKPVARGVFGADMKVSLVNDGPVTIIIDSRQQ